MSTTYQNPVSLEILDELISLGKVKRIAFVGAGVTATILGDLATVTIDGGIGGGPHATSHQDGGTDEINVGGLSGVLADPQPPIIGATGTTAVAGNDARLTDTRTPTDGSVTPAKFHATAIDPAAGTAGARTLGTGAQQSCAGNDSRLSDARTPVVHSIVGAQHNGFPGGTTNFLRADGTFAAPPSGGGPTKISGNSGAFVADTTWITLNANSSDVTVTTQTTVITLTGLAAGTYRIKGALVFQAAATTTGIGITLNHTGTLSRFVSNWIHITTGGAAATGISDQATAVAAGQLVEGKAERVKDTRSSFTVGVDTANADELAIMDAILIVTASGDLQLKIATEIGGSAVRLMAGSTIEVHKLI